MHRRSLIVTGLAAAASPALAQDQPGPDERPDQRDQGEHDQDERDQGDAAAHGRMTGPSDQPAEPYTREELTHTVSDFFGVTAENAGAVIERVFREQGRPTAYIAGQEGAGAFFFGLRYGKGLMYMKGRDRLRVFWQGPAIGFDWGGDAARVFTLCYNLQYPDAIFRRFPGVEGSAYLVGGLGVNYQRAEDITLAPIRAGVGLRLGANIGYLAYSRQRNIIPL